jgi:hypothetical protein
MAALRILGMERIFGHRLPNTAPADIATDFGKASQLVALR